MTKKPLIESFCFECFAPIQRNQGRYKILGETYCVKCGEPLSEKLMKEFKHEN